MSEQYGWNVSAEPPEPAGQAGLGPAGPAGPRTRRGLVAAGAAALLVLAVIGGTTGYLLAGGADVADPPVSPSAAVPTTGTVTASAGPTAGPALTSAGPTAAPPGGFALPDVTNTDFEQARKQLRGMRLGVHLIFASSGDDRRVERTEPVPGQTVRSGITVKLYVRGMAPFATIPGITGLECNQGGAIAADHGLEPDYVTGRRGVVLRTDPEAGMNDAVRWNGKLRIFCGVAASASAGSG